MSEELGKIEKPSVSDYTKKKKLYVVPLILSWKDAPADYAKMFDDYWKQVDEQLNSLESKMGKISKIYHEAVTVSGEEGLKSIEPLSPSSYACAKKRADNGASFELSEEKELVFEAMDWERFMLIGFSSQKVANAVSGSFMEATRKRYDHMAKAIDESLNEGDAGILFIREGHMVQFPEDIDVFSVAPPALDEIHRWLRSQQQSPAIPKAEEEKPEVKRDKPKKKGKSKS